MKTLPTIPNLKQKHSNIKKLQKEWYQLWLSSDNDPVAKRKMQAASKRLKTAQKDYKAITGKEVPSMFSKRTK